MGDEKSLPAKQLYFAIRQRTLTQKKISLQCVTFDRIKMILHHWFEVCVPGTSICDFYLSATLHKVSIDFDHDVSSHLAWLRNFKRKLLT